MGGCSARAAAFLVMPHQGEDHVFPLLVVFRLDHILAYFRKERLGLKRNAEQGRGAAPQDQVHGPCRAYRNSNGLARAVSRSTPGRRAGSVSMQGADLGLPLFAYRVGGESALAQGYVIDVEWSPVPDKRLPMRCA